MSFANKDMSLWLSFIVLLVFCVLHKSHSAQPGSTESACREYRSGPGHKSGRFSSEGFPDYYVVSTKRCLFAFVAQPGERVMVRFEAFNLRGNPPLCNSDYLDVYVDIQWYDSDNNEQPVDMLLQPLMGRFCGGRTDRGRAGLDLGVKGLLPTTLISSNRYILLWFYTDPKGSEVSAQGRVSRQGFSGTYSFVDASVYEIGQPLPNRPCGYSIRPGSGKIGQRGVFRSPSYPGAYLDEVDCVWQFEGSPGQRIKISFLDFDLFHGGDHCPFDFVRVFESYGIPNDLQSSSASSSSPARKPNTGLALTGDTNSVVNTQHPGQSQLIGIYCGNATGTQIFSTNHTLTVQFVTGKMGRQEFSENATPNRRYWEPSDDFAIDRRGFLASFEFSSDFVDLDFILEGSTHIKGTQCDLRVMSSGLSEGFIASPGHPGRYPPDLVCTYYLDGLMDHQHLEKVHLQFQHFDIPPQSPGCANGHLQVYLSGQDLAPSSASASSSHSNPASVAEETLCGSYLPANLTSRKPRITLVLNTTGAAPGTGFTARYTFLTDYDIHTGAQVSEGRCHFIFSSIATSEELSSGPAKSSFFHSPRHPHYYPRDVTCLYDLYGNPAQQVRVTFLVFSVGTRTGSGCPNDRVEAYYIYFTPTPLVVKEPIEILCGAKNSPGPILTPPGVRGLRIKFVSDNDDNVRIGFHARLDFLPIQPLFQVCGGNITNRHGGLITSPNHPDQYRADSSCDWFVYGRPHTRIMLQFDSFAMEGSSRSPDEAELSRGIVTQQYSCSAAVLNLYLDTDIRRISHSVCGSKSVGPFISSGHHARIRFIASSQAVGAKGFRISWTEMLPVNRQESRLSAANQFPNATSSVSFAGGLDDGTSICDGFLCKYSRFCIAPDLVCNRLPNCGMRDQHRVDRSDEDKETCGEVYEEASGAPAAKINIVHVVLGIVIGLVFLIALVLLCIVYRRQQLIKQQQHRQHNRRQPPLSSQQQQQQPSPLSQHLQDLHHYHHHHHYNQPLLGPQISPNLAASHYGQHHQSSSSPPLPESQDHDHRMSSSLSKRQPPIGAPPSASVELENGMPTSKFDRDILNVKNNSPTPDPYAAYDDWRNQQKISMV